MDVALLEVRHDRVEQEHDGAGEDQGRPDDPEVPRDEAEDHQQERQPDDRPSHLARAADAIRHDRAG